MSGSETGSPTSGLVRIERGADTSPNTRVSSSFEEVNRDEVSEEEREILFERDDGIEPEVSERGNDSETPSRAGSDLSGYGIEPPHNYIDMTNGDMCMVVMMRQKDNERVPCVCGNARESCARSGHLEKQGIRTKQGLPRFYVRFPGKKGAMDGRLDRNALTREEGVRMLSENREEMERAAQVLSGLDEDDDSEGIESVTPRVTREVQSPTILRASTEATGGSNRSPDRSGNNVSPTRSVDSSGTDAELPITWVGLEHPRSRIRVFYSDQPGGVIHSALDKGYVVKKTFATIKAAEKWANQNLKEITIGSGNPTTSRPNNNNVSSGNQSATRNNVSSVSRGNSTRRVIDIASPGSNDEDDDDDSSIELQRSSRKPISRPKRHKVKVWYGAERKSTKERAITSRLPVLRRLQIERFKLVEVFQVKADAERWLEENVDDEPKVEVVDTDDSDDVRVSSARIPKPPKAHVAREPSSDTLHPTGFAPPQADCIPPPVKKNTISIVSTEFFTAATAGDDPSTGNKEQIYNINHDDIDEMDIAMCPPHMIPEERDNFIDTVVDITALPGMFRTHDGASDLSTDADIATSIVATALGKKMSKSDVMWRTPAKNTLSRIKSKAQLYETIQGIERSARIAFQQQEGRMRTIMYRCNYDRTSIQLYLQAGLLPRMMRASYRRYIALLYKARQKVIDHEGYEDSLGREMITHHGSETMFLRQYSTDWRNFVIQTYVYLRDSDRKAYVDATMYEGLFDLKRGVLPDSAANNRSTNNRPANPDATHICAHCKCPIGEAHAGGKALCVFATLNAPKAREAGRLLLLALKESPKTDRAKKAKELLEEMGGGK